MRKHLSFICLCAFSVFLFCACEPVGGNDEQSELVWGTDSLCIESPIVPGETLCYQIQLKVDTLEGESELSKQLAAVLRDSIFYTRGHATTRETIIAFADSVEKEWKTELAERYEPEAEYKDMFQYYYTVKGNPVENNLDSIMSYEAVTGCYLGGAHGSHVVQYFNFDTKSGKLLKIEDIVPADKEMLVLMAMGDQLCKDWDAKDIADLQEKTGITLLGDLYLTNNFLLKGDSILFLFNQYEIAPYSSGLISVTLPRP